MGEHEISKQKLSKRQKLKLSSIHRDKILHVALWPLLMDLDYRPIILASHFISKCTDNKGLCCPHHTKELRLPQLNHLPTRWTEGGGLCCQPCWFGWHMFSEPPKGILCRLNGIQRSEEEKKKKTPDTYNCNFLSAPYLMARHLTQWQFNMWKDRERPDVLSIYSNWLSASSQWALGNNSHK